MTQQTLVLLKPDAVERKLSGRIITTLEEAGLTITAIKMLTADKKTLAEHYPSDDKWLGIVGGKTLEDYEASGKDVKAEFGTDNAVEVGKIIKGWLVDFMASGPIVAMVVEGNEAVKNVRRLVGHTLPNKAEPGSIRGRFSCDSPSAANEEKRPVTNLIHASGEVDEAQFEIGLWFPEMVGKKANAA